MWNPNSSTRRRRSASAPSAMRAPRLARRLASISSRSASSSPASAYPGSGERSSRLSRRWPTKLSLRRYGSSKFWSPISAANAASSRSSRSIERSSSSLTGTMRVETAGRARELAHLDAVARQGQAARAVEPLRDRVRPGLGIAVLIAADPGAEAQRSRGVGQALAVGGEHVGRHVEQRRLEEPQRMADLVDDARASRAHLVGLPERRDLGGHLVLELQPRAGGERRVVERLEDAAELQLGLQHGAAGGLGGMRGDHELERDVCALAGPARQARRRPRRACRRPRRATRAGSAARARSAAGCARDATPRRRWRAGSRGRTRAGRRSSVPRRALARRPRARPDRPPSRSSWPRARGGGRARRRPAGPRRPARRARARARRRPGGRRAAGRRRDGSGNARRPRRQRCSTWPKPMGMRSLARSAAARPP